ncbi:MAG: NUDIX hydrolase [Armatimonadota bacterium]
MELNEKTIESTIAFSGKLVKLRVDKVVLPNGKEAVREVVEHRGAIAAVPLTADKNVIMVRQYRQAAGQVLLEIPAGTLETNESPEKCAERELMEEIGYKPGKLTLMFTSYLAPGYSSELLYTFLAEDLSENKLKTDADELIDVVCMPLINAIDMIRSGEIKDAKTICGLLCAQRIVFNC